MNKKPKLILIGLDGGTFIQLKPMCEEGDLPNLSKYLDNGSYGILQSTNPPTTPPAWSTALTGVNPGKHGIYDFRLTAHQDEKRPLINLGYMKGLKLWDVLAKFNLTSGFLNVPVLYPPIKTNGFMVSGMMTPDTDAEFSYPGDLKEEILMNFPDYILDVDIPQYDVEHWEDARIFFDDLELATKRSTEVFFWLLQKYPVDFMMTVLIATDRIGHLFWKYLDPRSKLYNAPMAYRVRARVRQVYKIIDEFLGEVERKYSPESDILIMSDHGFGETLAYFNSNTFLEKMGLLKIKDEIEWRKKLFYKAWEFGDHPVTKKLIPDFAQRMVRTKIRKKRSSFISDLEDSIDFEHTKVFYASIPCHGFFIRRKGQGAIVTSDMEYNNLRERIKANMLSLQHIDGTPLIDNVWYREEIYTGPMTQFAPDIVFSAKNYGVIPRPILGASNYIQNFDKQPNGFHRPEGIFIALGEGIDKIKIENASLLNIAPTIINRLGLPLPPVMEGKPLLPKKADQIKR